MDYIERDVDDKIAHALGRDKSVLLLGPRQTGKTTILNRLNGDFYVSFVRPGTRLRYEKRPSILRGEIEAIKSEKPSTTPLVIVDEVQKIPVIMDVLQDLIDLGVRRLCAREGTRLHKRSLGCLIEQMVGLDLLRLARQSGQRMKIRFWRDPGGPEVDWVIDNDGVYIPIEVKWTDSPAEKDIRYLETFIREYPAGKKGYLVCRIPHPMKIYERITAIPWQDIAVIDDLVES